jgi:cell wall-associated NlpC family hydrolase
MTKYVPAAGDYGCVKTSGFFGFLIRLGTMSRWNHCFIYIGDGRIIEANPRGVANSPVSNYKDIAWNRHEELTADQREQIIANAKAAVGKPYGFFTIGLLVVRILGLKALSNIKFFQNLGKKDGFICSELVAEVYRKSDLPLFRKDDSLVVPGDLAERLIYQ